MINNLPTSILLASLLFSCHFRGNLPEKVHLSYESTNIEASFELRKTARIKKGSWEKGDYRYFYYGTLTAHLKSIQNPKELLLTYNGEESKVYLDTIVDVIGFWNQSWWDTKGFRKNNIYTVFDDPNIDWTAVKIIEKDVPKTITREEKCEILRKSSPKNFDKTCDAKE